MANAAINILSDGSIYDLGTVQGRVDQIRVIRKDIGIYELYGTFGMVPPPDGWGTVTNPMDEITTKVSYDDGVLTLNTQKTDGQPADFAGKVSLHILVEDALPPVMAVEPESDSQSMVATDYAYLKSHADSRLQLLQDLLDIGEGTLEIEARILAWKKYRVALIRIAEQPGYPNDIDWPSVPE